MSNSKTSPLQDKPVRNMLFACGIGFGGFALWGAFAPLEEGVAANGQIVVEGDRQVLQHLEGGIVEQLRVRDGMQVQKGDVLVVLEDTATLASRDLVIQEYAALAASVERMRALQTNQESLTFSALDDLDIGDAERLEIMKREEELFAQQRGALGADVTVLKARKSAANQTKNSRSRQITIAQRGLKTAQEELELSQALLGQKLVRKDRVTEAQRLVANLEADIAQLRSEQSDAASTAAELDAQMAQADAQFLEGNGTALLEASAALLAAEERLSAAQDVLNRSSIIAPVSGEILNMQLSTVGGVIQPGQTLMEIVPSISEVTASVRLRPADRSAVAKGQIVRTQFSSYRGWQAPRLEGEIIGVSADLKTDPATSAMYYEARIKIPEAQMQRTSDVEINAGMPVDAFIYSGTSRTFFDYLFDPLFESLFKGLRTA